MADKLTDADLVDTLKVAQGRTLAEAASILAISTRVLQSRLATAKTRGLTSTSPVVSELDRYKIRAKQLERELKEVHRDNDTAASIRQEIYGLATSTPEPPVWLQKPTKHGLAGVPMVLWSDWHWGEIIRPGEIGGVNEFNPTIGAARVKMLIDKTIDLAFGHMTGAKYPGIVVCLGGDFISGDIHEELAQTNSGRPLQAINEVRDQLIMAISAMADKFGKVVVPCVVGNHGRTTRKPVAKQRVFTSYEWNLYQQLDLWFRNDRRVVFDIPGETDAFVNVLGHRFLLTHGDALGVKGGDGIIGAIGPIARGTFKVGRSEAQIGRDFDTLLMGHWHTYIPRGDAVPAIVNGSLKGYDEYARVVLRVPYSRPLQALWFVHEKHGLTAQWPVYLDDDRRTKHSGKWVSFEERS